MHAIWADTILRKLIEKILVYEPIHVSGKKRIQKIQICYNFIGKIQLPAETKRAESTKLSVLSFGIPILPRNLLQTFILGVLILSGHSPIQNAIIYDKEDVLWTFKITFRYGIN